MKGDSMADIYSKSRELSIKKFERDKLQLLCNIQSKEIRVMELEEEIERCRIDIEASREKIAEFDYNIRLQKEEMAKEDAAAEKAEQPK
jgi:hypothetical protein